MLVSIIIPCYNVEACVAEAIESALAQAYRPIEIIAVDNNSTDRTMIILSKFQSRFPDLITLLKEPTQGASAARNKGMAAAKGEWLQFLDADDLILPDKIRANIEAISKNENASIVVSGHFYRNLSGKETRHEIVKGDIYGSLAMTSLGYTVSNLFKNLYNWGLYWNENMLGAEDMDFIFQYIKMFGENGIAYDKNILTITRQRRSGQVTTSNPLLFEKSCYKFQKSVVDYLKSEHTEYFLKNRQFFMDILYYFIYRIGMVDPGEGMNYFLKEMPKAFSPVHQPNNRISLLHEFGVWLIGLRHYFVVRNIIKRVFKV